MKKEKIFIFICLVLLSACSPSSLDGIVIEKAADGYKLSIDGRETYIKGVGGTYRLDIAAQSGANAFRTWGGNVEEIKKNLALASEHNMYVMQGIGMTKDSIRYYDDEYKNDSISISFHPSFMQGRYGSCIFSGYIFFWWLLSIRQFTG